MAGNRATPYSTAGGKTVPRSRRKREAALRVAAEAVSGTEAPLPNPSGKMHPFGTRGIV